MLRKATAYYSIVTDKQIAKLFEFEYIDLLMMLRYHYPIIDVFKICIIYRDGL